MSPFAHRETTELGIQLTTAICALLEIALLVSFGLLDARGAVALKLSWLESPVMAVGAAAIFSAVALGLSRRRWAATGLMLTAAIATGAAFQLLRSTGFDFTADGRSSAVGALLWLQIALALASALLFVRQVPGARTFGFFVSAVMALHVFAVGGL